MRRLIYIIIALMIVLTMGCLTNYETTESPGEMTSIPDEPSLSTPQPESTTQGETMTPFTPSISNLDTLIEKAKIDLARRLAISVDEIGLVEANSVVWPDTSLGCPQEGMGYMQVLTPGYLILLEHAGTIFEYHAGGGNSVVTCDNPSPPVPGAPGNT